MYEYRQESIFTKTRSKPVMQPKSSIQQSIELKFFLLEENNPKLKNLINKFSSDPQRKLKSVVVSRQGQQENRVNGNKQGQCARGRQPKSHKSTILKSTQLNKNFKRVKSKNVQFTSVFDTRPYRGKLKKQNFVQQNMKNAFNISKNAGFFDNRIGELRRLAKNRA